MYTADTELMQVHGFPFVCIPTSNVGEGIVKQEYELIEVYHLSNILKPGMTFIDAGANVGYFTVLGAKLVGPSGRVEAFEPDPFQFELLQKNIENNHFTNTSLHQVALGLIRSNRFLYQSDGFGDNRTWNDGKEMRPAAPVSVEVLDELLADLKRIDVMKVDVQGDEVNVLKGAQKLIDRSPNMGLTIEYWPYGLTANKSSPIEFADFLYDNHFVVSVLPGVRRIDLDRPIGKMLLNTVQVLPKKKDLLTIAGHSDDVVYNLLCIKSK